MSTSTTTDERIAPITDTTMKSAIEIDGPCTNISHITFASTASTAAIDERREDRGRHVLTDLGVDAARHPERAGVDLRAEPAAEGAEHVAPHADRGRNEDDEARAAGPGCW